MIQILLSSLRVFGVDLAVDTETKDAIFCEEHIEFLDCVGHEGRIQDGFQIQFLYQILTILY